MLKEYQQSISPNCTSFACYWILSCRFSSLTTTIQSQTSTNLEEIDFFMIDTLHYAKCREWTVILVCKYKYECLVLC